MKTLVSIVGTKLLQVCAGVLLQSHTRIEKPPSLTLQPVPHLGNVKGNLASQSFHQLTMNSVIHCQISLV